MTQGVNPLVEGNGRSNLATASHAVFADPALEQLPCREDTMLRFSELADCGRHLAIPHALTPTRTASNFLPASPEI